MSRRRTLLITCTFFDYLITSCVTIFVMHQLFPILCQLYHFFCDNKNVFVGPLRASDYASLVLQKQVLGQVSGGLPPPFGTQFQNCIGNRMCSCADRTADQRSAQRRVCKRYNNYLHCCKNLAAEQLWYRQVPRPTFCVGLRMRLGHRMIPSLELEVRTRSRATQLVLIQQTVWYRNIVIVPHCAPPFSYRLEYLHEMPRYGRKKLTIRVKRVPSNEDSPGTPLLLALGRSQRAKPALARGVRGLAPTPPGKFRNLAHLRCILVRSEAALSPFPLKKYWSQ